MKNGKKNWFVAIIEWVSLEVQKFLKIDRTKYEKNIEYKYGANWFSITNKLAEFIIEKESWIRKRFKNTKCADEIFLQTIVYNSKFKNNLYYDKMDDNYISCMRKIDWTRGTPYVWKNCDFEELINSGFLFARKFDYEADSKIVNRISNYLKNVT